MVFKINPNTVTRIKIFDKHEGITSTWHGIMKYKYMPTSYFKFLWLFKTPMVNYEGKYYLNGITKWMQPTLENLSEGQFDVGGSIWTKPRVEIFAGKEIKTKYFENLTEANNWVKRNLPDVNIEV